ncbi:MAG: YfaZ family outer membrane protein [Agitococcus sp.]
MKKYIALALTCLSTYSFADSASLDLNNDALRLSYQHGLSKNYDADFSWTHVKDAGNTFAAGFMLTQVLNNDISAQIGGKALFQQHDKLPDGTAMAVGGSLRITPAANKNIALTGSLFFAPNVLSFGDMDNYQELEIRGEYTFSPQLVGYAGYRNNSADYDVNGTKLKNVDLYDGVMIGAQFKF